MMEPQRLKWVQSGNDDTGVCYVVGAQTGGGNTEIKEIFLDDHGLGPMGHFHMITVRLGPKADALPNAPGWRRIEIPAHMATAWETIE